MVVVADGAVDAAIRERLGAAVAAGDLPKWAMPDRIISVLSIPRTSVGKIDKKRIRQMLETGEIA